MKMFNNLLPGNPKGRASSLVFLVWTSVTDDKNYLRSSGFGRLFSSKQNSITLFKTFALATAFKFLIRYTQSKQMSDQKSLMENTYADEDASVNSENSDLWKVFGRDTEAGRALFSLYKTGKPAKINYPKPKQKKWDPKEMAETQKTFKSCPQKTKIEYPPMESKVKETKINPVDLIPHRKGYDVIQKEIEEYYSKPEIPVNKGVNRLELVNNLQKKFNKGRGALPKGAELPVTESVDLNEAEEEELKKRALAKVPQSKLMFVNKRPKTNVETGPRDKEDIQKELDELYNKVEEEIMERQKFLEEIDHLDEPKLKEKIKGEIVSRVAELQKIIKMLNA